MAEVRPGLLSTVMMSVVKSTFSRAYISSGTPFRLMPGFVENEIEAVRFHLLHHDVGNLFDDAFAHAQRLFLQLAFARLAELVDLALHVFDVRDLVVRSLANFVFASPLKAEESSCLFRLLISSSAFL